MANLQRTLIWNALYSPGAEYFNLWREHNGWRLEGKVAVVLDSYPVHVHYHVACDVQWHTRVVEVEMKMGATTRSLHITVDERRRWHLGGEEIRAVRGCYDVDLSVTPATNTLPIRRLNLTVGENADVAAAWILFPELTVRTLSQKYTHLEPSRYWYQSELGDTIWDIEVDDLELVRRYSNLWEAAAVI
jgi:hypothetical protein